MEKLNDQEYAKFMRWLHSQKVEPFRDSQLRALALFGRKPNLTEDVLREIRKGDYQKALEKAQELCK